jgi:predicted phage terminase large subunit-like protein
MLKKDKDKQNQLKKLSVIQAMCKTDLLFFTRYFFRAKNNRKYTVAPFHRIIAASLNRVVEGSCIKLIISIPPRFGKTELAIKNLIAHGLALNQTGEYMHLSYSDLLAIDNSKGVKDIMELAEYKQLFGNVELKSDSRSAGFWKLDAGAKVYATSIRGQVTGFGAGIYNDTVKTEPDRTRFFGVLAMDDTIKPEDADSDVIREEVNYTYTSTIKNRLNTPGVTPQLYIGHRVHPNDLPGHLMKTEGDWKLISLPALLDYDQLQKEYEYMDDFGQYQTAKLKDIYNLGEITMPFEMSLFEQIYDVKRLYEIRGSDPKSINVFGRQYMQDPKPLSGLMYPMAWKVYDTLPFEPEHEQKFSQTDCADEGECYLCSIKFIPYNGLKYIIDMVYTQESTETTEELCAELNKDVNYANFESNNGGKAFARNVERICRDKGYFKPTISWYHESSNKDARIRSNSSTVQNVIVFPIDWGIKWPKFYDHVTMYSLSGKNKYKDGADVLTAMCEKEPYGDQWATIH